MWPIPKKCSYLLARNATCSVSFEWHLQCIILTSFHQKQHVIHLARRWLSPLCLWCLTKEICRFMFPWNDIQFVVLFAIILVNCVLFLFLFPLHNSYFFVFVNADNMSKMNPVFSIISTLTRSPLQMHNASEWVDFFFFAPQEREMIQDDAILHKQLTSPCIHSSSPIMSFMWQKFILCFCQCW